MTETSDILKAQTSGNQLNQPNKVIDFDPNNSMQVISWLKYFNDKCQNINLDDSWKITNIPNYLKSSALTDYMNCYDKINNWEEFTCFLTEKYLVPSITSLNDFTQKTFNGKEIAQYLEIARQFNLPTSMILEGLRLTP
ncbi:transposon Tf2-6 polyprotein [Trichonephila clavipes]|nr:transposon Tf2-6 polyprotein [Trichonephila clavipes]